MKTLYLTGIRQIEMGETPAPTIRNDNDVLIRVKTVGVCGSDIHYFTDGKIGSQVVAFPFVIGHECSGEVVAIGGAVTRVKPGDLVAVDPSIHCGKCDQCLAGRPHTCRNNVFLGCPGQIDGCLSEYIVMPDYACYPVPASFDATLAALIEPLSIGTYCVELAGEEVRDKSVAIFGCGPIGLSVLLALHAVSARPPICFEPLVWRREKANKLGAAQSFDPFAIDAFETIRNIDPLLFDVVFECSGSQKAVDDAVRILKPGGKLFLIGIPAEARFVFDMDLMRRKEITVQNVRRQNHCVEKSIEIVGQGIPVQEMVTHRFTPEKTQKAFEMVENYKDGVIKALIDFC